MGREIITKDGDMLDALCRAYYGREDLVPEVLEANPGLAAKAAVLEAGLRVLLPDLPEPAEKREIRLWA